MVDIPLLGGVLTSEFEICNLKFAIFRPIHYRNALIFSILCFVYVENCKLQIANSFPV